MDSMRENEQGVKQQAELAQRFRRYQRLRPASLSAFLLKATGPDDRRRIVQIRNGLRLYLDPFTHLGQLILVEGEYEPETERVIREHVKLGDAVLDIGANEGYFSAVFASLVGATGQVICIEPQTRLRDILEINLRLNDARQFSIYRNAIGGAEGEQGVINLWPSFNTGASGILRTYRFSRATETFQYISIDSIMKECQLNKIDFVKVDVEGFEGHVVKHLMPHLQRAAIRKLFVDFHASILTSMGIDAGEIHQSILAAGYRMILGDAQALQSYILYEPANG